MAHTEQHTPPSARSKARKNAAAPSGRGTTRRAAGSTSNGHTANGTNGHTGRQAAPVSTRRANGRHETNGASKAGRAKPPVTAKDGRHETNGASKAGRAKPLLTAKTADKHVLYQKAVQNADIEIDFIDRVYRSLRKRLPKAMREDFCGTALVTSEWVRKDRTRTAVGVDLDPKVLAWAKAHNLRNLGEALERVELLEQDVRTATKRRFDVINAFNFSYWVFKTRPELRQYFETVRRSLKADGMFFLDAYGGWEAQEPMLEPRRVQGGFTYVWDQDKFDPISHRVLNHIHFEFKDGSKLEKAFTYDWRYWTLPELYELLIEAGFSDVQVHWDVSDDADGDDYRPRKRAANQPGWLAYIVALR